MQGGRYRAWRLRGRAREGRCTLSSCLWWGPASRRAHASTACPPPAVAPLPATCLLQGIQVLLSTLIISLPAIVNVGALLVLLFFVFAVMGELPRQGSLCPLTQASAWRCCWPRRLRRLLPAAAHRIPKPPTACPSGVLLFGRLAWQQDINAHANFATFPRAALVLFRVATGDNWCGAGRLGS